MTSGEPLLLFVVVGIVVATIWMISAAPDITEEERKEMEDEW